MIVSNDLEGCPEPVALYLRKAGVVGCVRKKYAHILHGGEFRLKPKQKWFPISGEYYFHPETISFSWKASIRMFPLVFITVRDEYENGKGRSVVKLESIFPIADQAGPEISESSLGRLLIEFIMIPTALVPNKYLHWESINSSQARVVLHHNGFTVSAIFDFGSEGLPIKTTIERFGKFDGKMSKKPFICHLSDYRFYEGLLIPTDIRGGWDFPDEIFYWMHFEIKSVQYK